MIVFGYNKRIFLKKQVNLMGNDVSILWIIVGIIGIVIAVALAINLADYITFFRKELRHLNQEIGRTSGREQRYWKKRKRRLLLSLIPFIKY